LVKEKIKQVYLARVTRIGKENSGRLNKGSSQHGWIQSREAGERARSAGHPCHLQGVAGWLGGACRRQCGLATDGHDTLPATRVFRDGMSPLSLPPLAISPGPRLGSRPPFQPHALIRITCCRCDVQLVAMWQSCISGFPGDAGRWSREICGMRMRERVPAKADLNLTRKKSTFVPSQSVLV